MRLFNYIKNNCNKTKKELNELNSQNLILVNGTKMNLSYHVKDSDIVTVNGKVVSTVEYKYYLYNKPIGVVCTNDTSIINNIKTVTNINDRIYSVGRLDKMSHGLVILTNDGALTHFILSPDTHLEKEYIVKVNKDITDDFLKKMEESYIIKGKQTKCAKCKKIANDTFSIILKEGKYHQIRIMTHLNGYEVIDLFRWRIASITIDDLEGKQLKEIKDLKKRMEE